MRPAPRPPMLERDELEAALHALAHDVTLLRMKVEAVRRREVMPAQWQHDTDNLLFRAVSTVNVLHDQVRYYWPCCPEDPERRTRP